MNPIESVLTFALRRLVERMELLARVPCRREPPALRESRNRSVGVSIASRERPSLTWQRSSSAVDAHPTERPRSRELWNKCKPFFARGLRRAPEQTESPLGAHGARPLEEVAGTFFAHDRQRGTFSSIAGRVGLLPTEVMKSPHQAQRCPKRTGGLCSPALRGAC